MTKTIYKEKDKRKQGINAVPIQKIILLRAHNTQNWKIQKYRIMCRNSECIIYQHGNKNQPQRYLDQKEAAIDPMERRKSYFITYIPKIN